MIKSIRSKFIVLRFIKNSLKQHLPIISNSIKYGKLYRHRFKFLQEVQYWPKEQIEDWQLTELQKLIKHSNETVPYYKNLFKKHKIIPSDIQCFEDIIKIPYLTKKIIRENLDDLISNKHKKNNIQKVSSGGSTGTPLGFYWQKDLTNQAEQAFLWFLWSLKTIKLNDKFAVLRGNIVPDNKIMYYHHKNRLILSSYHLTDDNIEKMIKEIEKFNPDVIQAYPSALYLFTKWIQDNNYKWEISLKAILTSSENLYGYQEILFKNIFKTQIFDLYGNSERTVMINRCEKDGFHVLPFYGFTELINEKGEWCSKENERGEIVSTGFNNYAFPFIRYKTQDIAINTNKKCECDRNWKLIKSVEGRLQDYVITNKGHYISCDMITASIHSDVLDNVKHFQFHQREKGKVVFKVIKNDKYSDKNTHCIRNELIKKLGNDIELEIRFVSEIPRTKSGKYRFLIQELPVEFGD